MADKIPCAFPKDEHVRRLDKGFVEAVVEGAGDVFGAGDPGGISFDVDTDAADGDLDAARVIENARPGVAYFIPSYDKVPSRMDALNPVFRKPNRGHLGDIERLESGVEALIGLKYGWSGVDGLGNCFGRHV